EISLRELVAASSTAASSAASTSHETIGQRWFITSATNANAGSPSDTNAASFDEDEMASLLSLQSSESDPPEITTASVPTVTEIAPNSGPITGGTEVIVTGSRFTGATAVNFGSSPAASFVVVSDSEIT